MTVTERGVPATARRFGGQSMVAPLRTVMVRRPAPPETADDWRRFGYLRPVDHGRTEYEHEAFREILAGAGIEVIEAGRDRQLL